MFFEDMINESSKQVKNIDSENAEDTILGVNDDDKNPGFIDDIAKQVNIALATEAFNSAGFFDGGTEAVKSYLEDAEENGSESYLEGVIASIAKNNTVLQLNRRDDMKRRVRLACLLIAKRKNDPLFKKVSIYRMKERAAKKAIYGKYMALAYKAAKVSVLKHDQEKTKETAPKFVKDRTGNKASHSAVTNLDHIR